MILDSVALPACRMKCHCVGYVTLCADAWVFNDINDV